MKKVLFLTSLAAVLFTACSKSDSGSDLILKEGEFPKKITYKNPDGKVLSVNEYNIVSGKIHSFTIKDFNRGTDTITTFTVIKYDGDYPIQEISEETRKGGPKYTFTTDYTFVDKKLVKKVEKRSPEEITTEYKYDKGNLIQVLVTYKTDKIDKTEHEEVSYAYSENKVVETSLSYEKDKDGKKSDERTRTTTYTYQNDNLMSEEEVRANSKSVTTYTYDTRPNPLRNNLTILLDPDYFITSGSSANNVLTEIQIITEKKPDGSGYDDSKAHTKTNAYTYEYNQKGLVTKVKQKEIIIEYEY